MIVGVPRETFPGERRVALVPMTIPNLVKAGLQVVVEAGAGAEARYSGADFWSQGAENVAETGEGFCTPDNLVPGFCPGSANKKGEDRFSLRRPAHIGT